jgi:hypothetical protein
VILSKLFFRVQIKKVLQRNIQCHNKGTESKLKNDEDRIGTKFKTDL